MQDFSDETYKLYRAALDLWASGAVFQKRVGESGSESTETLRDKEPYGPGNHSLQQALAGLFSAEQLLQNKNLELSKLRAEAVMIPFSAFEEGVDGPKRQKLGRIKTIQGLKEAIKEVLPTRGVFKELAQWAVRSRKEAIQTFTESGRIESVLKSQRQQQKNSWCSGELLVFMRNFEESDYPPDFEGYPSKAGFFRADGTVGETNGPDLDPKSLFRSQEDVIDSGKLSPLELKVLRRVKSSAQKGTRK